MRKMFGKEMGEDGFVRVVEHIMTKNFWEFYIVETTEGVKPEGHATAVVVGDYTEFGDVYMPEIEPYIISRTAQLDEIMPAPNWRWENDEIQKKSTNRDGQILPENRQRRRKKEEGRSEEENPRRENERLDFKMSDRLFEFIVTGTCIAAIVAGAIFGTWALLVTMGM